MSHKIITQMSSNDKTKEQESQLTNKNTEKEIGAGLWKINTIILYNITYQKIMMIMVESTIHRFFSSKDNFLPRLHFFSLLITSCITKVKVLFIFFFGATIFHIGGGITQQIYFSFLSKYRIQIQNFTIICPSLSSSLQPLILTWQTIIHTGIKKLIYFYIYIIDIF